TWVTVEAVIASSVLSGQLQHGLWGSDEPNEPTHFDPTGRGPPRDPHAREPGTGRTGQRSPSATSHQDRPDRRGAWACPQIVPLPPIRGLRGRRPRRAGRPVA